MNDNTFTQYLAENPKMVGVLFTLVLLLTQAGNAMGGAAMTVRGP